MIELSSKECVSCGKVLPATTEFFRRNSGFKDGLRSKCKACLKEADRLQYLKHRQKRLASSKKYQDEHYIKKNRIPKEQELSDRVVCLLKTTKKSQTEIGNMFGVSTKVVHQIQKKAGIKRKSIRIKVEAKKCKWCEQLFRPKALFLGRPNRGKFCSKGCYTNWQKSEENKGSKHPNWKSTSRHDALNDLRKSEQWKFWRSQVFMRDNFTCQLCGRHGGRLHPHHIKRKVDQPDLIFEVNNGITLCEKCHNKVWNREGKHIELFLKIVKYNEALLMYSPYFR